MPAANSRAQHSTAWHSMTQTWQCITLCSADRIPWNLKQQPSQPTDEQTIYAGPTFDKPRPHYQPPERMSTIHSQSFVSQACSHGTHAHPACPHLLHKHVCEHKSHPPEPMSTIHSQSFVSQGRSTTNGSRQPVRFMLGGGKPMKGDGSFTQCTNNGSSEGTWGHTQQQAGAEDTGFGEWRHGVIWAA
jgi:hypothetical protein